MPSTNPFLDPAFNIRWSLLTSENIRPAIEAVLTRAQSDVDAIAARDLSSLNYQNTFLALERATEELNVAWGKVTHLQSVADSPALRDAHNALLPGVSSFYARIPLNPGLWLRLKAVAASPAVQALTGIHRRFVDETLADFRQAGADLPPEKRARLEAIQSELAQITQKYGENVLDSTNAWQVVVTDEARLAGIPAHAKAAALRSAEEKGLASPGRPAWRFTLHAPSQEPVMTYAEDETLRRDMWTAAIGIGAVAPHDNSGLIQRILSLRAEKSGILGKPHFADFALERRMAGTGARALAFIEDMKSRAQPAFVNECAELEQFRAQSGAGHPRTSNLTPQTPPLAPWEIAFWSERLRKQRYDFDEEILRPYFPMDRVIAGLFEVSRRVFGLNIKEVKSSPGHPVEAWHADVKFYEMRDDRGRHVGSFYTDWHPRESKRGGAWMGYLITGGPTSGGGREPHLGYICGNMTPPASGRPALLTHREVQTIFHEFGHLIHHLLGEVEIKSLNGVNVAWDFVELPSQILENWCWERESLDLFARHVDSGALIPDDIFAKMTAARNFRSACAVMRQVQFSKLDLVLHTRTQEFLTGDLEAKARAEVADCFIPTQPPARTIIRRFTHLFSDPMGYAAGYYSYKWAEVLDADAFSRFQKEGVLNRGVGAAFVDKILSRGNSANAAELFRSFMGRDPDPAALLRRCGLA